MKGLLKYLSPFAPDQSGAQAVFYDLGGIIVISDAGGCTGNICGFDEPRWFGQKSRIFSAGLRDMDAILGRDDKLVEKLKLALSQVGGEFAAIIGTPVPAVTATDYRALKSLARKKTGMTILAVECKGTALYDEGAESAWEELFDTFTKDDVKEAEDALGIIGMTPLDLSITHPEEFIEELRQKEGFEKVLPYGMGAGLKEIERAGCVKRNLVVSPAGLKAARKLKERFGTPYSMGFPFFKKAEKEAFLKAAGKKTLVIHQQAAANEIRKMLTEADETSKVTCATWFKADKDFSSDKDLRFETEEQFRDYVLNGDFDAIIGDPLFKRAIKEFKGIYIDAAHYAVSGYDGE
ncbi:MAG: nitrogenase component 1 [Lachnospiraceae bacterium]|nr:nitrogenase component 1 [Lachnospiraceae bacterium]